MRNRLLIWTFVIILLSAFVNAGIDFYCYQESANLSNGCGQYGTGVYNFTGAWYPSGVPGSDATNLYDGNWSSYAQGYSPDEQTWAYMYINYTKPQNSYSANWQSKHSASTQNTTLSNECWNQYEDKIVLRLSAANYVGAVERGNLSCYNGTWKTIYNPNRQSWYEEGIHWNINLTLDDCSNDNAIRVLNVSLRNISDDSLVVGTMEFSFNYTYQNNYSNFSVQKTDSEIAFCMSPNWTTFYTDALITYSFGDDVYEYNLVNYSLSNTTKILNLYTQDSLTRVTFTVTDILDNPIQGAYIKILKYDVGENTYKTTEILETNNDGEDVGNIVLYTTWYQFIIEINGVTQLITDPSRIWDTEKIFRIDTTASDWFNNFDIVSGTSFELNFTNSTKNFRFTWNDPTGEIHNGCLKVIQRNTTIEREVCNNCTMSTAATVLCNIGTVVEGNSYFATAYFMFDDKYIVDIMNVIFDGGPFEKLWEKGDDVRTYGVFLSFIMITALTLLGIWAPLTAIILMLVGFFIVGALGFLALNSVMLITLIGMGVIVLYRVSRK